MPAGAPRKYDRKAILNYIQIEMAKGVRNLHDICEDEGMPTYQNIYLWVAEDKELFDIFTRAQELWCWAQKDIIIKISDDDSRDIIESTIEHTGEDGTTILKTERRSDNTAVNRDKLRVGARQWAMTKLLSKIFGEKLQTEQKITIDSDYVDRPTNEDMGAWQKRVEKRRKDQQKNQVVN